MREIRAKIPAAAATECCFIVVLQQVHLLSLSVMCPHTFPFSFLFPPFATTTTTFFSLSLFDNQNYLGYLARLYLVEIKRSSIIRWKNGSQFCCFRVTADGRELIQRTTRRKTFSNFIFFGGREGRDAPPTVEREREKHVSWHFIPLDLSSALCVAVCFVFGRVIF